MALLGLGWMTVASTPASAAACAGQVRYAASTNTTYVTSGTVTLSDIKALCPAAPLALVDAAAKTWLLSSDVILQGGATLVLKGSAVGGDVDTLRMQSRASALSTEVADITAMYGTITIDSTHITSWDDQAGGPDTDPSVPSGGGQGRSFIRAISYLDADGVTARESTMTIRNSDLGYLGYYGAESYGVAYKVRGDDGSHTIFDKVNVYGSQTGSRFHDGWMGTYTFGAQSMQFTNNEYDHNVMYGLDPHDDSDYLLIDHNHFHDNGDHGVICSQRCDHLTITNNESDHNGIPPFAFPGDTDLSDNQIHGIMIHRGVTATVISNNWVHDQPNGAGIAVFDSSDDVISNNVVERAKFGIRFSVGTTRITVSGNTFRDSSQYGIYMYKGSDPVMYNTATGGRPSANLFTGNVVDGAAANAVKTTDADANTYRSNTFTGTLGSVRFATGTGNLWDSNTAPSSLLIGTYGISGTPGATTVVPSGAVKTSADTYSTTTLTNAAGRLLVDSAALPTTFGTSGSSVVLDGTAGSVTTSLGPVAVAPSSGTLTGLSAGGGVAVTAPASTYTTSLSFFGLTPGTAYRLQRDGSTLLTATADSTGVATFNVTPLPSVTSTYTVAPG